MAGRGFSDDELRLYELLKQFIDLSDDKSVDGRIIILSKTGAIIGDATLAEDDVKAATDALLQLNIRRADFAQGLAPAAPLPVDDTVTDAEVQSVVAGFESLLNGEGGE